MSVTEQELERLLNTHGWTIGRRTIGKQQAFSAKKYRKEGNITRYISTEYKLKNLTEADIVAKLNRPAKNHAKRESRQDEN